ncbi:MAG: TetR/AcrR family transcriptional regulator C-terminal domain-containing protein [Clostridia bacterium]|nr:TetR/AcrR family transcriptional regulator C-terminal domain-containing protein [Clostridia bacterium]MBR7073193.1 TetR/AcrR family transcriptional regulator C-terminal domain-containing protein [Eubacterium sp.]
MGAKNNARRQETINKIKRVFIDLLQDKDISQITVSEICKKAGISRNTFYLYFTDVYDLAEKFTDSYCSRFFARLSESKQDKKPAAEFLSEVLEYMAENQAAFNAFFKVYNHEETIKKQRKEQLDRNYDFWFFAYGQSAVVRKWLKNGCVESPAEIAEILAKYINPTGNPDYDSGQRDKDALRQNETVAKIESALIDLLQIWDFTQISVSDICSIADISREDFYSYYQDIIDLGDSFARKMFDEYFTSFSDAVENNNLCEACSDRFDRIYRNQKEFTAFLKLGSFRRFLERIFVKFFNYDDSDPSLNYIVSGQQATVFQWVKNGFDKPPAEISEKFIDYLKRTGIWYKELKQRDNNAV